MWEPWTTIHQAYPHGFVCNIVLRLLYLQYLSYCRNIQIHVLFNISCIAWRLNQTDCDQLRCIMVVNGQMSGPSSLEYVLSEYWYTWGTPECYTRNGKGLPGWPFLGGGGWGPVPWHHGASSQCIRRIGILCDQDTSLRI